MRKALCVVLPIVLFVAVCHGFAGEYRETMTNCRLEGGYCFDPRAAQTNAEPGEAEAAGGPATAAHGGGRRPGPNPLGRAAQPPPMSWGTQMDLMSQQCASTEFDLGCFNNGGSGMCCTPWP